MTAYRAETLPRDRDELRGGHGRGEQHEDGGARRPEQRGQRLRRGCPSAVAGERTRAGVNQRVPMGLVPRDPAAGTQGDRDEEEPCGAGNLPRRPVAGIDLKAAAAQPARAGAHFRQRLHPSAAPEPGSARRDVRLEDPAADRPVREDSIGPNPVEQADGLTRQVVRGRHEAHLRQVGSDPSGMQVRDEPQFVVEGGPAQRGRRHGDQQRDPAAPGGGPQDRGDGRVLFRVAEVSGPVGVEPPALARMRCGAVLERQQAGRGLGERRDDESASGQGVGADLPPPHARRPFVSPPCETLAPSPPRT